MRSLIAVVLALVTSCAAASPALEYGADTPDDLRRLADATFSRFVDAFPNRTGCLHGVTVEGARRLDDRARYRPDEATITVRIPATAPHLEESLVHELAHHLELACEAHAGIRAELLTSMGLDPATDWFDGPRWEEIPSERFASATVLYVLDRRDQGAGIPIDDATLEVIDTWAAG
jgi:hypothetical protein